MSLTQNVGLEVSLDYGVYPSPEAYSKDYYIYGDPSANTYLYDEVAIYARVKLSGGFTINDIGRFEPTGLSVPNLSPIRISIPYVRLPFTIGSSINFSGIYSNMYRYGKR